MPISTKRLLLLGLLSCFYSCTRKQQALYQFTPSPIFTQALLSATNTREVVTPISNEIQLTNESLMASSAINLGQRVDRIGPQKDKKEQPTAHRLATKTLVTESYIYERKKSYNKFPLLKQRSKDAGPQTSGLAIASLVSGILAFFIFGVVFGPLAVILGGVALSKIRKNPEVKGHGLAVAGLILGILATIFIISFFLRAA